MNQLIASALAPFAPPQSKVHQIVDAAKAREEANRSTLERAKEQRLIEQQQQYLRATGERI